MAKTGTGFPSLGAGTPGVNLSVVRALLLQEIEETLRRLRKQGERTIILEGNWRDIRGTQFKTDFPECNRVHHKYDKYVLLQFSSSEHAAAAFKKIELDGYNGKTVTPKYRLDGKRYTSEGQATMIYDTSKLQISELPPKVTPNQLKQAFPGVYNVIYPGYMARNGMAVLSFKSVEDARQAFEASKDFKMKDADVTVVYSEYQGRLVGYRDYNEPQIPPPPVYIESKKENVSSPKKQKREEDNDIKEAAASIAEEELKDMETRLRNLKNRTLIVRGNKIGYAYKEIMGLSPEIKRVVRNRRGMFVEFDSEEIALRVKAEMENALINNEKIEVLRMEEGGIEMWQSNNNINPLKLYVEGLPYKTKAQDVKKLFPAAKLVFMPRMMFANGKAIVIYESLDAARSAFKESKDFKIKDKPITVTYMIHKRRKGDDEENEAFEEETFEPAGKKQRFEDVPLTMGREQQVAGLNEQYF